MAAKNFASHLAVAPRGRIVAFALMYGPSLALRLTSANGEEIGFAAAAASNSEDISEASAPVRAPILRGKSVPQSAYRVRFDNQLDRGTN